MSYAVSAALQKAVFQRLSGTPALTVLVGQAIYDAVPTGSLPETFVSLGAEQVQDASDQTGDGALHRIDVSVRTQRPGFAEAKAIAVAISDALHNADLSLERGRLVYLRFLRGEARRVDQSAGREVRLRFGARVDDQ
ncbi:MAG: DUF3168 domain-containing protein [Pseudomonadota bacterium]